MTDVDVIQADIQAVHGQIKRLQVSTIECVSFKPTGKVEIVDKERLESLNSEIDRLTTLAGHNEAVFARLNDCLCAVSTKSVAELEKAQNAASEKIASLKIGINRICGDYLRISPTYTLETIKDHPKVRPEVESREAWIAELEKKLESLGPALDEARTIAAEFQPSGLLAARSKFAEQPPDRIGCITRASVEGLI